MKLCDISLDLVEEILLRVSATSSKAIKSTCKQWNVLFKDQSFAEKHFGKASKQALLLKDHMAYLMSVGLEVYPPSLEFKGPLCIKDSDFNLGQVNILGVFHCDGLLLCTTKDYRLVVWNPCLGRTWWIQHNNPGYMKYYLGQVNHSFKILKCSNYYIEDGEFEIYDASSSSWRAFYQDLDFQGCIVSSNGVSLKGNIYWCVTSKDVEYEWLLTFDFTREKFRRMCILPIKKYNRMILSVVREEQLSALHMTALKIEIWVTSKFDNETALSWTKSFTVDIFDRFDHRKRPPHFASFLMDEDKKVALCCSPDPETRGRIVYMIREADKYYREISYIANKPLCLRGPCEDSIYIANKLRYLRGLYGHTRNDTFICSYVPSLFQFQQVKE